MDDVSDDAAAVVSDAFADDSDCAVEDSSACVVVLVEGSKSGFRTYSEKHDPTNGLSVFMAGSCARRLSRSVAQKLSHWVRRAFSCRICTGDSVSGRDVKILSKRGHAGTGLDTELTIFMPCQTTIAKAKTPLLLVFNLSTLRTQYSGRLILQLLLSRESKHRNFSVSVSLPAYTSSSCVAASSGSLLGFESDMTAGTSVRGTWPAGSEKD